VIIIGHSMGGMLGMRYALTFPDDVEQLVLVNPIGLEDWKAKGVPWQSIDGWYQQELKTTADSIRDYQRATYYAGTWDARYEPWVQMLAGLYRGPGHDIVAWNAALTDDMAYTQPVFYEFEKISAPVLLLIGDKDTTAIGKHLASPAVRATLGHYPALAKEAAARFPHAQLVEFPDFGHAPQIQAPDVFHKALLDGLQKKLRLGEDALERYQQALQNAIHLGGDLGGDVSLSQFGGQQIGGALTDICEHGLCPSPCVTVRAFTDATQAQRFQLDGRELRIGMIAQSRKQRERRAVDGLVVGVERS
jgi:hypothetical protein